MAEDRTKLFLGPCQCYFGTIGAEASIGFSEGGAKLKIVDDRAGLKYDRGGTNNSDSTQVGRAVTVEVAIAEISFDVLQANLPGSEIVTDDVDPDKKKLVINTGVGQQMVRDGYAKRLILKPVIAGVVTTNALLWWTILSAAPKADAELAFDRTTQQVVKIMFEGYPDDNLNLAIFGDETATP
jgi:hypothetical protein